MFKNFSQYISTDSKVMCGKPVIRGTRIPVDLIVRMFAQGLSTESILGEYPSLKTEDIHAALGYAAEVIAHEDIFPLQIPA